MHVDWNAVVSVAAAVVGTFWAHRKQVAKVLNILLTQDPPPDQGPELQRAARWLGAAAVPAAKVLLESKP